MKLFLIGLVLVVAAVDLWVRFAPSDPARWNIPPASAADPGMAGYRLIGADAPVFPGDPQTVLKKFEAVALSHPRVIRLAGTPESGLMTYVIRSMVWGFPDYLTVEATAEGDKTRLALISRARFGRGDLGVNKARVTAWLAEMSART